MRRAARAGCSIAATLAAFVAGGCDFPYDRCDDAAPGDERVCPMPGYLDRAFSLAVPAAWDGASPLPIVFELHGGGGNRTGADRLTCPGGDAGDPACLRAKALAAGYAVVQPDGVGTRPLRNLRTWNAGGGAGDWQCTSGAACASGSDDVGYFDDLHAELARILPIDAARVYATGISNGAAMVYRLACERPERLAAIAPVGGGNQFAAAGGACAGGVAVLHIHGTADPCWAYGGGTAACAQKDGKRKVGVDDTLAGARARNGCSDTFSEEPLPDAADDGMTSVRVRWQGCAVAVELVRVDGGGHTWPGGWQYASADRVGPVTRDFDADDLIVEFFDAHPKAR